MLLPTFIKGHVTISDAMTGEILIDKDNQIHYENMSEALATAIAKQDGGYIYSMAFGNGGTSVDTTGVITYLPPNTNTQSAGLYNETYEKVVNQQYPDTNTDIINNKIEIRHLAGEVFTDILISCTTMEDDFVFDELGIKSNGDKLLTHVIFHPIQKSLNRLIQIDYTIRIQTLTNLSGV
jgi:hypothetical protein